MHACLVILMRNSLPDRRTLNVLGALLDGLGRMLLLDDVDDIGWGRYTREQRPHHVDTAPNLHPGRYGDHPSPFHHWQLGAILYFTGLALQNLTKPKDKKPELPRSTQG